MHLEGLVFLFWQYFENENVENDENVLKMLIILVFDKSVTDGPTDRLTDLASYRDARKHLKKEIDTNSI